jgi:hypothetical protein
MYRRAMTDAPIILLMSISGGNVLAAYANLPPNSGIVFVNKTSGQPFGGIVPASGSSSITIATPPGMPGGAYYLKARDSTGAFLAESVEFYVDAAGGPSGAN